MTNTAPAMTPLAVDTRLAELGGDLCKLKRSAGAQVEILHRVTGDRTSWEGRRKVWGMTRGQVLTAARASTRVDAAQALARIGELAAMAGKAEGEIAALDAVYQAAPWTRYFRVLNPDGHIHSTERGCSTVHWDTAVAWNPHLSGKTVADAIADLGPTLCSVCYPDAPAEHRQNRSDLDRSERDAKKAARAEARYVKELRPEEQFRGYDGSRVTTVFQCKVELCEVFKMLYNFGGDPHPWYPQSVRAAADAARVLLARGVTQAEIDKIRTSAKAKNRKNAIKGLAYQGITGADAEAKLAELDKLAG